MNTIENDFVQFEIVNEILYCYYKPVTVTLAAAKCIVADRMKLTGENEYPCYTDVRQIKNVTPEASKYLAQVENCQGVTRVAFLVKGRIVMSLMNIFLYINKPPGPCKSFFNETEALNWLLEK